MTQAELLATLKQATADAQEGQAEISKKITDMEKKIQDLLDGMANPDITDPAIIAQLRDLSATLQSLKDIVPDAPPPEDPEAPDEPEAPSDTQPVSQVKRSPAQDHANKKPASRR